MAKSAKKYFARRATSKQRQYQRRRFMQLEHLEQRHLMAVLGPVDDGDTAYTDSGYRQGQLDGGYAGDYRAGNDGEESLPVGKATWTLNPSHAAVYKVWTTWREDANRATNATYQIFDGSDARGSSTQNQRNAPSGGSAFGSNWSLLGQYSFVHDAIRVELPNTADGWVIADGVYAEHVQDLPEVSISAGVSSVVEGNTQVAFTVTRDGSTSGNLTVKLKPTLGGTATSGQDYEPLSSLSVVIPSGSPSATFTLSIKQDSLDEPDETVIVSLDYNGAAYGLASSDSATVTITDEDPPGVWLQIVDGEAREQPSGEDKARIIVHRSSSLSQTLDFNLQLNYLNGATVGDISGIVPVHFAVGATQVVMDITAVPDSMFEGEETVEITIPDPGSSGAYTPTSPSSGSIKLLADRPRVWIEAYKPDASEDPLESGEFRVRIEPTVPYDVVVNLSYGGSTATADEDYAALPAQVTISANQPHAVLTVDPENDDEVEVTEDVVATVSSSPSAPYYVTTSPSATVSIESEDKPTVSIVGVSEVEGDLNNAGTGIAKVFRFRVALSAPISDDVEVTYHTAAGTGNHLATADTDYKSVSSGTITIGAGGEYGYIEIGIIGDKDVEYDEEFRVVIDSATNATVPSSTEATGTIIDDDKSKNSSNGADQKKQVGGVANLANKLLAEAATGIAKLVLAPFQYLVGNCGCPCQQCPDENPDSPVNNTSSNPHPIIAASLVLPTDQAVPDLLEAKLTFGSLVVPAVFYSTEGLVPGDELQFKLQVDATLLPTDRHEYTVEIIAHTGSSSTTYTVAGESFVFNRIDSEFGNRWHIPSISRLKVHNDGVALIRGDVTAVFFKKDGSNYVKPVGSFETLTEHAGGYTLLYPNGSKEHYDLDGLLVAFEDRLGNDTTYLYVDADSDGQQDEISVITDPFGRTTSYAYANGRLSTMTDLADRTTTYGYDAGGQGWLTSITLPDPDGSGPLEAPIYRYEYHPNGLVAKAIDPLGRTQSFHYDEFLRLTEAVNPDGASWSLTPVEVQGVAPSGTSASSPAAASYLKPGKEAIFTDELGRVTKIEVDGFGYETRVVDPALHETTYVRDGSGLVLEMTEPDPDGPGPLGRLTTRYAYDGRGNLTHIEYPDGTTESWEYESSFNKVTRHVDRLNRLMVYAIDPANGNLLAIREVIGQEDGVGNSETNDSITTFTYTVAGTLPAGLLLTSVDPQGRETRYAYYDNPTENRFGRLKSMTSAYGTADQSTVTYDYDAAGNVIAVIDPMGNRTDYQYDHLDRRTLTIEADPDGTGPLARPQSRVVFDAANQPIIYIDAQGATTRHFYDAMGRRVRTEFPNPNSAATSNPALAPFTSDDGSVGYAESGGGWFSGTLAGAFEGDYRVAPAGTGASKATWSFSDLVPGKKYEIHVSYSGGTDRASNAPYTIVNGSTTTSLTVNQQTTPTDETFGGARWKRITTITASATSLSVELSNLANGNVIADGVRLVEVTSQVVDDGDATYVESPAWTAGGLTGAYGNDYRVRPAGTGEYAATWTLNNLTPGKVYEIFVTYLADANRANNAPFTVRDGSTVLSTVAVNQRVAPGDDRFGGTAWKSLGQFIPTSTSLSVELRDVSTGYVIADAVRFVERDPLFIDDGRAGFTGNWTQTAHTSAAEGDFRSRPAGTGQNVAAWNFSNLEPGASYEVYVSWIAGANRATNATYNIQAASGGGNVTVNQQSAPTEAYFGSKGFKKLGVVQSDGSLTIQLSDLADGLVVADAIRLVRVVDGSVGDGYARIIDDFDSGYEELSGIWVQGQLDAGYQEDYRVSYPGTGDATARWSFNDLIPGGNYEVYVTWRHEANRASNAPFTVATGGQALRTFAVNQQVPPSQNIGGRNWHKLGQFTASSGDLQVLLTNQANGVVIADGVRIVQVGPLPAPAVTFQYDAVGNLVRETDPLGRSTLYAYNALDQLTTVTLPDPGTGQHAAPVYQYTYGPTGLLLDETDPTGSVTAYRYDAMYRPTKVTKADPDAAGPLTSPEWQHEYDNWDRVTKLMDPLGRVTEITYNDDYVDPIDENLVREVTTTLPPPDPAQPTVRPVIRQLYDRLGNLRFSVDAGGDVTEYHYDNLNRLIQVIEPDADGVAPTDDQPVTDYQYDASGRLVAVVDPLDRRTEYQYDGLNRLTKLTLPDPDGAGGVTASEYSYAYDVMDRLILETDALGRTTQHQYDVLGRKIRTIQADPDGTGPLTSPIISYQYDHVGQLVAVTDPMGRVSRTVYDRLGRITQSVQPDPDSAGSLTSPVTRYTYDAAGYLKSVLDPLNHATSYDYDALHRLTRQTDARGGETDYTYDAAGNLLTLTDSVENTTTWVYDGLDRVIEETNELSKTRYFGYDLEGNLLRKTDRLGRVTEYDYDHLDRLTAERWLDSGNQTIRTLSFSYDVASQLISASDPSASYGYQYDGLGRVTSQTQSITGLAPQIVLSQAFDKVSNRTERSATIGGTADFRNVYSYDNLDRTTRITQQGQASGNAVTEKRFDFSYDASGLFTKLSRYADLAGVQHVASSHYTYDGIGRLSSLIHSTSTTTPAATGFDADTLAGYRYSYDSASRITAIDSFLDGLATYAHDETDQLIGADHTSQTDESYSYDENGNRAMIGYQTGGNNQLISDGTYTYTYDDEGNRLTRTSIATGAVTEYEWDHRNRLTNVTEKDSLGNVTKTVGQSYDVFNRWILRTVDEDGPGSAAAVDTFFAYDGLEMVLEFDGSSAADLAHRYSWGVAVDQILADEQVTSLGSAGNVITPLADHLGTIRDLADRDEATGAVSVVNHRGYNSFGFLTSETNPAIEHHFGFTGRYFEITTGLGYHYRRWYDSAVGRWVSEDPIGFNAGDANLGRYVSNQPLLYIDPSGLAGGYGSGLSGLHAAVGGPVNIHDAMVKDTSAVTQPIEDGKKVWGNSNYMPLWKRIYVTGGTAIGTFVGVRGISDACSRHDAVDGHEQSRGERIFDGVSGGVQLVGTATGIKGAIAKPGPGAASGIASKSGGGTTPIVQNQLDDAARAAAAAPDTATANPGQFSGRFERVSPNDIRFSQNTAGGNGRAAKLREQMRDGWNGPAVDAVETADGIVTIDNTRIAVARELGICEVPVKVRLPADPLPESMLGRFGNAKTWGEALKFRTGNQRPPLPETGTPNAPRLPN